MPENPIAPWQKIEIFYPTRYIAYTHGGNPLIQMIKLEKLENGELMIELTLSDSEKRDELNLNILQACPEVSFLEIEDSAKIRLRSFTLEILPKFFNIVVNNTEDFNLIGPEIKRHFYTITAKNNFNVFELDGLNNITNFLAQLIFSNGMPSDYLILFLERLLSLRNSFFFSLNILEAFLYLWNLVVNPFELPVLMVLFCLEDFFESATRLNNISVQHSINWVGSLFWDAKTSDDYADKLEALEFENDLAREEFWDSIPQNFICPIAKTIMTDPVVDPRCPQFVAEKKLWESWIDLNEDARHPYTQDPLKKEDLVSVPELKQEIQKFVQEAVEKYTPNMMNRFFDWGFS